MDTIKCIRKRRTIRFFQQRPIEHETLVELVDLARLSPSAANKQPLEYLIVVDDVKKDSLFEQLAWAAYVQPKRNPPVNKRPVAYIIVLVKNEIAAGNLGAIDAAAAIQTLLLAACAKGIGSCWLGAIQRDKIRTLFNIPDDYAINSVVALGYPAENPQSEDAADNTDTETKYYLDENDQLHVPKRPLAAICHFNMFE